MVIEVANQTRKTEQKRRQHVFKTLKPAKKTQFRGPELPIVVAGRCDRTPAFRRGMGSQSWPANQPPSLHAATPKLQESMPGYLLARKACIRLETGKP
jgi:hypothetical protein